MRDTDRKGKRWEKAEIKLLMRYAKEGLTNEEIAKKLNRTKGSVEWKLYKHLKIRKGDLRLPKLKKRELQELYYGRKLTLKEIAKMFHCSISYIFNQMKKLKIPRNRKRCRKKPMEIPNKNFKNMSPEKAYILGVLCGDGSLSKTKVRSRGYEYFYHVVGLDVTDKDFAENFKNAIKAVYGVDPSERIIPAKKRKTPDGYSKCKKKFSIRLSRKKIFMDLRKYGNFKKENWEVPKEIKNTGNKKILGSFLRGFFDSDGSVDIASGGIEATSSNEQGLKEIKILFKKFNIYTKVEPAKKDRDLYRIRIRFSRYLKKFKEKINFGIKRKRECLKRIISEKKDYPYTAEDYWNVLRLRIKGYSSNKISAKTGFPRSTVKSWFKKPAYIVKKELKLGNLPDDWGIFSKKFNFLNKYRR